MKKKIPQALAVALICLAAIGCTRVIGGTSSTGTQPGLTADSSTTVTCTYTSVQTTLQSEFPNATGTLAPEPETTTGAGAASTTASSTTTAATTAKPASTTTTAVATTKATTKATTTATTSAPPQSSNSYATLNYDVMKAAWISYLEYDTMLKGKSESAFRASIGAAFDKLAGMGLNTVIVHARAHGDAYYASDLFPWAQRVTGTMAKAASFDPLAVMIEEAHSRKLSVQAWINPMRLGTDAQMQAVSADYATGAWYQDASKRGTYIVKVGDFWYLNPAYAEVRGLIAAGVSEIVAGYDVDGMHIDDYFYPTTNASFDSAAYAQSGAGSVSAFRLDNVSRMVKSIHDAVKAANAGAIFGASPQGNIDNNYNNMYADVRKWCATPGYVDYIAPQIYYGFENSTLPFDSTVKQWNAMVTASGVRLITGLAAYKIGKEDTWAGAGKTEWQNHTDIIARQMKSAAAQSKYGGFILYRYDSFINPASDVKARVEQEVENFLPLLR